VKLKIASRHHHPLSNFPTLIFYFAQKHLAVDNDNDKTGTSTAQRSSPASIIISSFLLKLFRSNWLGVPLFHYEWQ